MAMPEPRRVPVPASGTDDRPVLEVRDLTVTFLPPKRRPITVVDGLSLDLHAGRAHALVGESGSGKSVSMRALMGLLPQARVTGSATLRGDAVGDAELVGMPASSMRSVRGARIGMIFQNAMDAMNPTLTVETQLCEPLLWHGLCDREEASRRAVEALRAVGIPEPERRVKMYPFQLSGGMRQRVMIAIATIVKPEIVIADEPTTALDVTVQLQILDLLNDLKKQGMAIVMITHDLGVARYFCDDISVLYSGQIVEQGTIDEVLDGPLHPYTEGLRGSVLELGDDSPLHTIPGQPPDPSAAPRGCRFAPRCPLVEDRCLQPQPLIQVGDRTARCWKATDRG